MADDVERHRNPEVVTKVQQSSECFRFRFSAVAEDVEIVILDDSPTKFDFDTERNRR
jgi:hypothetical protein